MRETSDIEIKDIEKKIGIMKRMFIVGIILFTIGLCCIFIIVFRINQLQQELDQLDQELNEKSFSELTEEYRQEHMQRLDKINQELSAIMIIIFIFGLFLFIGPLISISASNHRKSFSKLKKSHLNHSKEDSLDVEIGLSFKPYREE